MEEWASGVGRRVSVIIGLPVGTMTVLLTLAVTALLTDEKILDVYVRFFGDATAWLLLVFPLALRAAGGELGRGLAAGEPSLRTRFRYAMTVNVAIWTTYALVSVVSTTAQIRGFTFLLSTLGLPAALCAVSIALTPFTIGRLIALAVGRTLHGTSRLNGS